MSEDNNLEQVTENNEPKLFEHDWYDPEPVWQTFHCNSVRISNFALKVICKHCLVEVIGTMGSDYFIQKLQEKSCIE